MLQDLSQYQNDEILHESLHLLGRFFSAEENLFEKAIQTQVIIFTYMYATCCYSLSIQCIAADHIRIRKCLCSGVNKASHTASLCRA